MKHGGVCRFRGLGVSDLVFGGGSGVQGVRGIGRVCRFRGLGVSDLVFGGGGSGVQGVRGIGRCLLHVFGFLGSGLWASGDFGVVSGKDWQARRRAGA